MMNWEEIAKELAYLLYRTVEGDSFGVALETLEKYNFIDENQEWIYEEDE